MEAELTYGLGTRSYNRSAEAREERKRREANLRRMAIEGFVPAVKQPEYLAPLMCDCRSFRYRHEIAAHKKLSSEYDWRTFEQRESDELRWISS